MADYNKTKKKTFFFYMVYILSSRCLSDQCTKCIYRILEINLKSKAVYIYNRENMIIIQPSSIGCIS